MNQWKTATKLWTGFTVIAATLLGLGVYQYRAATATQTAVDRLSGEMMPALMAAEQLRQLSTERRLLVFESAFAGSPSRRAELLAASERIKSRISDIQEDLSKVANRGETATAFSRFSNTRAEYVTALSAMEKVLAEPGGSSRAMSLWDSQVRPRAELFAAACDELVTTVRRQGEQQTKAASEITSSLLLYSMLGIGFALLVASAKNWLVGSLIASSTRVVGDVVNSIAAGDLSRDVPATLTSRGDEFGEQGRALQTMTEGLRRLLGQVQTSVNVLSEAGQGLLVESDGLERGSRQSSEQAQSVAAATEEMSSNVSTVAVGIEQTASNLSVVTANTDQMTETIGGIAASSGRARQIAEVANRKTQEVRDQMRKLGDAAREIGKVTETINEISSQTNLLALNATIEAARAGAAGKGFAVVAGEIKALAQQTAQATEDIRRRIEGVQGSATTGIEEIAGIGNVIAEVNDLVSSIAVAIEEQSAATKEIARNISEANQGVKDANLRVAESSQVSREIARDIAGVNQVAGELSAAGTRVRASAEKLSQLTVELSSVIKGFRL